MPRSVTRSRVGATRYGSGSDRSAGVNSRPSAVRTVRRTPPRPAAVSSREPEAARTVCTVGTAVSSARTVSSPESGSSSSTCCSAGSRSPASTSSRPSWTPATERIWTPSPVSSLPSRARARAAPSGVSAAVSIRPSGSRTGVPGTSGSTQWGCVVRDSSRVRPVAGSADSSSTFCWSRSWTVSRTSSDDSQPASETYGYCAASQSSRTRWPPGPSTHSWTSALGPPASG